MRFRVVSDPPIKPFKAWFDVPDDGLVINVFGVKSNLCSRLPQLGEEDGANICLFIDGFELLDDSGLDVIKENDLVHISTKQPASSSLPKKRKSIDTQPMKPPRKKRHTEIDTTNDSDSSYNSETESETDSSSTSNFSAPGRKPALTHPTGGRTGVTNGKFSDFGSDSSSASSSSAPTSEPILRHIAGGSSAETDDSSNAESSSTSDSSFPSGKKTGSPKPSRSAPNQSVARRVPPGQGKPATRSRNARRRIKRTYERQQREAEEATARALATDSVNSMPLGSKDNTVPVTEAASKGDGQTLIPATGQGSPIEVEQMVTSLKNKNKKKGFKNSMSGVVPQKILFSDESGIPPETGSNGASSSSGTLRPVARLITPSEKQAMGLLPSNMFVTSVEVEAENWNKKKKSKQRNMYGEELTTGEVVAANDNTILNYGDAEIDWASVDGNWDKMEVIADPASLTPGATVGWKALAINPITFTPETLVHIARVKEIKRESTLVVVEPIPRPGSDSISFGASADVPSEGAQSDDVLVADVTCTFEDVLKVQWKLVNI